MTLATNLTRGLAVALALGASHASALRLHDIEVASYLNEPLKARIKITDISADDASSVVPSLGSVAAFQAAGIERTDTLADLTFSMGPDGQYLYITSDQAVREPFLLFLLRADWREGSATREYAMLLDLPGSGTAVAFQVPAEAEADTVRPFLANQEILANLPRAAAPEVAETPANDPPAPQANLTDVVVKSGDSLSLIARRYFDPELAPSLAAFTQALFELNPSAFIRGDINLIRAGASLQIPSAQPAPVGPTMIAENPVEVEEIAVVEAPNSELALVSDTGIVDDSEAQYLRQRIQALELELANMQAQQIARAEIANRVASETGSALAPLSESETAAIAPVAPVAPASDTVAEATPIAPVVEKTGPAPVAPIVAEAPAPAPTTTSGWNSDWTLYGAAAGLIALLLALFGYRQRTRREPLALDPDELEPEIEPTFEPEPMPVAKPTPRLATQDRTEHALLLCAYGQVGDAMDMLQQGIDRDQDDQDYSLIRTLARITHAHDPDAFAVLIQEQTSHFPERHALLSYLAELAGSEAIPQQVHTETAPMMSDEIILGSETAMDTIEFTLELDEQKS